MILIKNTFFGTYANDIRALVSAFYPGSEILFVSGDENRKGERTYTRAASKEPGKVRGQTVPDAAAEAGKTKAPGISVKASGVPPDDVPPDDVLIDIDLLAGGFERDPDRFTDKSRFKKLLYLELSALTGRRLPWGTLTGIRPVRILEMLRAEGLCGENCDRELRDRYLISDPKIRLLKEVEETESGILGGLDYENNYSIYINIPFCPGRCLYCSFASNPVSTVRDRIPLYLRALKNEMDLFAERISPDREPDGKTGENVEVQGFSADREAEVSGLPQTVYIGGGTPTALDEAEFEELLRITGEFTDRLFAGKAYGKASKRCGLKLEYTVEAGRPDSISRKKLEIMRRYGVKRISVNPQTFNQKTLDLIGRRHSAEETERVFYMAREAGFENINMDLIMGLPGETADDVKRTLEKVSGLKPDCLTVHTLSVKRAARLSTEGLAWGGIARCGGGPDEKEAEEIARMVDAGRETAEALGMRPYYLYRQKNTAGNQENTGYALPGKECLYNIFMMEEKQTVYGFGAGASTKVIRREAPAESGEGKTSVPRILRRENVKNLDEYIRRFGFV